MLRAFIDSSVLFSAAYSQRGHARDLMILAARGQIRLVISELVMEETRRNLAGFAPEAMPALEILFDSVDFEIVHPSREAVQEASKLAALKDAPILAAAKVAQVDMLVTLDKKHLLGRPELATYAAARILRPAEAYARLSKR